MKIMRNNMSLFRMEGASHTRSDSRVQSGAKGNGNYDAITIFFRKILSLTRQIQEKTFSEALSRQVVSEAGQGASPEKVAAVKRQVEEGTYHVDPYLIASRMLLSGEAYAHG